MTLQNFLRNIERRVAYSARNFLNWQFLAKSAARCLSIIEHDVSYSARNVRSHSFLMSEKFETLGCQ